MYKNKAAVIKLNQSNMDIDQFKFSATPYFLPNFMNLFDWSMPFVSEKIIEIYAEIYKHLGKLEDEEINSQKFIQAFNEVKNDSDLKDKIAFLDRKRKQSVIERMKNEKKLEDSKNNDMNPTDLDY